MTTPTHASGPAGTAPARPGGRRRSVVLVAAGLAAVLVVAALSHPWWLAPLVGRYLSGTSGRDVHFDSVRLGFTLALEPVLHLRGVRIANAPWADAAGPFAALEEAVMVFSWRSLSEDRRVISLLVLRGGEVDMERQADGLRNWRLRRPEDRGPGRYRVLALEAHRTALRFAHRGIELDLRTVASDALAEAATAATGEALETRIDFAGELRQVAFKGRFATGAVLSFLETGRWFGVKGHAEVEGARLDLDGRVADIFQTPSFDAQVALAGKSLAALGPFLGGRYPVPHAFRAEAHLKADAASYALTRAKARVGVTDLAGEIAWSRDKPRRAVRARLTSESADLADLTWLAGRAAPAARKAAVAAAAAASRPAQRQRARSARDIDVDLDFDAKRFHAADIKALQGLKLKAKLADGLLTVWDVDAGVAGGHVAGKLAIDFNQAPASAKAELQTRGIRLETLLPAQDDKRRISGALQGRAALQSSGDSAAAMLAGASGSASITLTGGTISSLLDAQLGLAGGKIVRTMLSGAEPLALPCASAAFDVRNGIASVKSLVVDSASTLTTGSGAIDLRKQTIDLVLTPEPKRAGLFDIRKSIRLYGRLAKPERALVDRLAQPAGAACAASKR